MIRAGGSRVREVLRARFGSPAWGLACLALGCVTARPAYPPEPPLWRDPDRAPFAARLPEYFSPVHWDALDQSVFRPVSQFFAVDPGGEALDVNAWDEVPDSSWFENRIGRRALTPEGVARGPCALPALDASSPWEIVGSKGEGADPGFLIRAANGHRYLIKFDGLQQGPRATLADVLGSLIYYAAGFDVPCYSIVSFSRATLTMGAHAHAKDDLGNEIPLTWADIDKSLSQATALPGQRYRGVASLYLDGRPLGPWRYSGTLPGDRNDIIPHEDRRELRASRLLAAWTSHSDQREGNTLAMWIETAPGMGFVRHHLLDFGDCFGDLWDGPAQQAWRRGSAYFFDPWQMLGDFATLGAVERPWDRAHLGPSGLVLSYYGSDDFEPEAWRPGYPNPAFGRMTERDAAWMARIIARFDQKQLAAAIAEGQVDATLGQELLGTLWLRRQKILSRYLTRLSALADPTLHADARGDWLCASDLAVQAAIAPRDRTYLARLASTASGTFVPHPVELRAPGEPCVQLPRRAATGAPSEPDYFVIEIATQAARAGEPAALPYPARFHVYERGGSRYSIAGIERRGD